MINLPVKMQEQIESSSVFPIELYEAHLPNQVLRFCASDTDITYNGNVYIAVPVERGEITKGVDTSIDSCELTLSNTTEMFTQMLFSGVNFIGSRIFIYQIMYPDSLADPTMVKMVFYGTVDSPELTSEGTFKVQVVGDIPNVNGGRMLHYPCNSRFGDSVCKIQPRKETATIQDIDGRNIILNRNIGGNDVWIHGIMTVNGEGRRIENVNDRVFTLEYPFFQSPSGMTCEIVQGCDKTTSDCDRYRNRKNYSGFLSVPYEFEIKT